MRQSREHETAQSRDGVGRRLEQHIEHFIRRNHPRKLQKPPPVFDKSHAIPVLTEWSCHLFILSHALWPVLLEAALNRLTNQHGHFVSFAIRFLLYTTAYTMMIAREANVVQKLGKRVGFLDGDKQPRDGVPRTGLRKAILALAVFAIARPSLTLLVPLWISTNRETSDLAVFTWSLPLKLSLYPLVVDFWFYVYHRIAHENKTLWRFHQTHHHIRHPIPFLASYADMEQEMIEVVIVPLLAFGMMRLVALPLSFSDWWICQAYILFEEILGHSGLRVYSVAPSLASPLLRFFGVQLVIEDHDLHHRIPKRLSCNYGKQTRLWDELFGTQGPRFESTNVDYAWKIHMPIM